MLARRERFLRTNPRRGKRGGRMRQARDFTKAEPLSEANRKTTRKRISRPCRVNHSDFQPRDPDLFLRGNNQITFAARLHRHDSHAAADQVFGRGFRIFRASHSASGDPFRFIAVRTDDVQKAKQLRGDRPGRGWIEDHFCVVFARKSRGPKHCSIRQFELRQQDTGAGYQILGRIDLRHAHARICARGGRDLLFSLGIHGDDRRAAGLATIERNVVDVHSILQQTADQFMTARFVSHPADQSDARAQPGCSHCLVCAFSARPGVKGSSLDGLAGARQMLAAHQEISIDPSKHHDIPAFPVPIQIHSLRIDEHRFIRQPRALETELGDCAAPPSEQDACMRLHFGILLLCAGFVFLNHAADQSGRQTVVLESTNARVTIDLGGGAIGEFRLRDLPLNPLNWAAPGPEDQAVRGFGHFLCLDRWGPASDAEAARGMPYHGEASNVRWQTAGTPTRTEAVMSARLPKARLSIRRTVRLSPAEPFFVVREEVKNENDLGRIFNMVQHPTIAPPFLDPATIVDCNGQRGFAQGGSLPNPEEPSADWPYAIKKNGDRVDLRRLASDPDPNVVSYAIDNTLGWVTAASPKQGLLIGYVWRTSDYPWVSLWRDVHNHQPAARGLEFGTTGLHQPFATLTKKGRIWDRPLFEYLDAGESTTKEYAAFLAKIPAEFSGVDSVALEGARLRIKPKGAASADIFLETGGLFSSPK